MMFLVRLLHFREGHVLINFIFFYLFRENGEDRLDHVRDLFCFAIFTTTTLKAA